MIKDKEMFMKKLLSIIMMTSILSTTTYSKKSQAGVILLAAGITMVKIASHDRDGDGRVDKKAKFCYDENNCITLKNANTNIKAYKLRPIGMMTAITGGMVLPFFGYGLILGASGVILPVCIAFVVLGEDGSLPKEQVESMLLKKYPFLDHESALELALAINTKAEKTELDKDGKKIISLSEFEVKSILEPSYLNEEEVIQVTEGLK